MNRKTFNQKQIAVIEDISAVLKCSEKTITYTKEFKLKALRQYAEGMTPTEIFREAGFDNAKAISSSCTLIRCPPNAVILAEDGRLRNSKAFLPPI